MKVASVLITLKIILGFALMVGVVLSWFGSRDVEAVDPIVVDENAEQCRTLARALDVVGYSRHRLDLIQAKAGMPTCARPDAEGCRYLVEVAFELQQADRRDLAEQVRKTWDYVDCDPELRFAVKYGLEAYRDARILMAQHE
jgi:hypothetical protein